MTLLQASAPDVVRLGARARRDAVVRLAAGSTLWLSLLLVTWWWVTGGGITQLGGWATGLESVGGLEGLGSVGALSQTPAVRNGRVYAYEDQYLFGMGPRIGQFLDELVTALHEPAATTSTT